MNYSGRFETSHPSHFGGLVDVESQPRHGGGGTITIPDAHLLFNGEYKRSGVDLILSNDGHELVVHDYFKGEKRASLASPDGAHLTGDIVNALVGHVEYAQAANAPDSATVIGHVTKLTGSATVIRNGVAIVLNIGDNVNKGDVVQSGSNSSLGLTFIDGTVFGLSSNARMVLNEMVYDPNGSNNSSLLSLVQGTITFVAGETAKHGDMKIDTPATTLGIRGTAVLVEIDFTVPGQGNAPPVTIQLLAEPDGHTGSFILYNKPTDGTPPVQIGTISDSSLSFKVNITGNISQQPASNAQTQEAAAIIQQVFTEKFPNYTPPAQPGPDKSNPTSPNSTGGGGSSTPPPPATPHDTSPITPTPPTIPPAPINLTVPESTPGSPITIANQTLQSGGGSGVTIKAIDVTPAVDKPNFLIADQVKVTDSNPTEVVVPYVPGTAVIVGPPEVTKLVTVNAQTGAVSYNPANFQAGTTTIITITFDSAAGTETFHNVPLTLTIDGAAVAPTVLINTQGGTTETATQTFNGTVTAGSAAVGATVALFDNDLKIGTATVGNDGSWTATVTLSGSGTHSIIAQDTDAAGITGTSTPVVLTLEGALVAAPVTLAAGTEDVAYTITAADLLAKVTENNELGNPIVSITAVSVASGGGAVVANANGSFTYTPALHYSGPVSFNYTASDGTLTSSSTASLTLTQVDQPPVATPVVLAQGTEDVAYTITSATLLAGVSDVDGPFPLSITAVSVASGGGAVVANANGSFTYTPALHYSGPVSFNYTASDGTLTSSSTASLTLTQVDQPPVATPVVLAQGTEDVAYTITAATLLAGVSDVDGPFPLSITAVSVASGGGAVVANANGSFTYTPALHYSGPVSFNYTASDGTLTSSSTASLTLTHVDQPPVATPVVLTQGTEDVAYTITSATLLAGVSDVDGPFPLSITAVSVASGGGAVVANANGSFTYTPALHYSGPVSFNYTASDGTLTSSSTASLTLTQVDQPPVATPVVLAQGTEDVAYTITAATLLAGVSDVDTPAASLTITAVSVASGGGAVVANANGSFTYTPALHYSGPVSFNYTASDGTLTSSSTASLTLTHVDQPPVATPVVLAQGTEDVAYTITAATLLAGVSDVDGPFPLSITAVSVASGGGAVVANANGSFTYTPALHYSGPVSFNYTASDGTLTSSSTASLTLTHVDQPPVATPVVLAQGTEDVAYTITAATLLAGVSDVDGPFPLSITAVSVASGGGAVVANANGSFTYTPALHYSGPVSFNYTASDGTLTSSSTASLTLTQVDQPPVATPVVLTQGTEDVAYTITAATLLAGVSDVDGPFPLSITAVSVASGGGAVVANANGSFTYTPALHYSGPVSFNYTASDGTLTSSSTASLTLTHVDQPPVATPVVLTQGTEDVAYTITAATLLAGVSDVDTPAASLTITAVSVASGGGAVVANPNGSFTYTPALHYSGPVSFNYTASDGTLTSSSTASLTLTHVDQPPVATPVVLAQGTEDVAYTITAATLLAGVSDVDTPAASLTITAVSVASGGGAVVANANGSFTYTPALHYSGPVSFNYTASDGTLTSSSTASLTLAHVDQPPVATPVVLAQGTEDVAYTITAATLLAGVSDVDTPAASLTITAVSVASGGGAVVANANGSFTYTPALHYSGPVSFNYTASDGTLTSSSTASLTLTHVDQPPVATPVVLAQGTEDVAYTITAATLLAGVSDVDTPAASLTITAVSVASGGGAVVANANGSFTYTPALHYSGPVSFNYTASDGTLTSSSTASLTLAQVDQPPVATPVVLTQGTEDVAYTITSATLLAGVSDVDGPFPLSITAVSVASGGGAVVANANGSFTYTPALHYSGPVSFNYTASDGTLTSSSTASLTLTHVDQPPVINEGPQTATVADGGTVYASGHFTATDPDSGDTLTWSIDGGSRYASESYQYGIDEFAVNKVVNGSTVQVFDDTFNGTVPPTGPAILVGSSPAGTSYNDFGSGTYVQGNGEALFNGSNAGYLGIALGVGNNYGDPVFGQFTTLVTGTSFNAAPGDGLRSGQSFSVSGLFDLTTPADGNTRYGIRLSDRASLDGANNQPGTETVDLGVVRNGNGTASVLLSELNFETGISTTLQVATINVQPGDNEILLSLSNDAAHNGQIVASYTLEKLVSGVEVPDGPPVTLAAVGHIFDNEDWTRSQFYSIATATTTSASPNADSILQGTYGQLDIAQDGTWRYFLNPGLASVKALAAGQTAQDDFQVTVTDAAGAHSSQTVSVTVTGINDPPVATAPTAHYSTTPGTALNLANTGLSVTDVDGGGSSETVTLSVGEGIINVTVGTSGVSVISASNGTGSVTFSGTVAQISALLNGSTGTIVYNDNAASPGSSTMLTLTIKDSGGLSDSASATIDLGSGGFGSQDWAHNIDIFGATVQETPTQWTVPNYDGLTSTVFNGGGITYDPASGLPTNGGVGSINLVDNLTHNTLETITLVGVSPGDLGAFISRIESIQDKIAWSGLIETDNNGPISFSTTDIHFANTDGTFTDIIGTGFAQTGSSQLSGTVAAVEQLDAHGNVLQTVNFGLSTTLSDVAAALFPDEASKQFYDLMAQGNTTLTGVATQSTAPTNFNFTLDDAPGNHTFIGAAQAAYTVNFQDATLGVTANLAQGTASWGGNNDTLVNIPNIIGSKFADTITGGFTGSWLDGGGAAQGTHDTLTETAGSAGNTFVFAQSYGALTITNFDQANGTFNSTEGDQIALNGFSGQPTVSFASGNTVLDFGNNDVVTLLNVTQSEFTALNGSEFTNGGSNNNGPSINNAGNTITYAGTPVFLDPSVAVSEVTAAVTSVNVWISSGLQSGDQLTINGNVDGLIADSDGSAIHYHFDGDAMSLSVSSGSPTLSDFNSALQLIKFSTSGDATVGGTDTSRTITWAAQDSTGATSPTATTTVDLVPVLNSMVLTVSKGGTTLLTNSDFNVTDPGLADFYAVTNLAGGPVDSAHGSGGQFEVFNGTNWVSAPTGSFTTAQIAAGQVEFVQDGSATAPNFRVWVSDGIGHTSAPIAPVIGFFTSNNYTWNQVQYPTVVQGLHQFGVNPQYDAAAGIVVLAPGGEVTDYATTDTSYVDTRYVESLDPFFLPGHHAAQTITTTTVSTPARSNFIIPNVGSSLTPEGIYVYKGQANTNGTGGNVLWEVTGTSDGNGGVTFSNPTQIGDSSTTGNTIYNLTESFKNNSSGIATSYDVAWDQYNGSTLQYNLELQITTIDPITGAFGTPTIISPILTESGGATSVAVSDTAHMPAWQFRSIGSSNPSAAYALAIAETDNSISTPTAFTGLNLTGPHDAIVFQGYTATGGATAINSTVQTFAIQPNLSAYAAGATNDIDWETIPSLSPYPGQTAQAIEFVQVSSANNGQYAVAWNETVTDSAGTHDQVEFVLTNVMRATFQIADGNAQNVRIVEFADPATSGQDDVVVVYGDDTGTHILEYGVSTTSGVTSAHQLASFTDPTTQAFQNLTAMGDGRITITYDNLVNALPDETSQFLFKTFDLRTAGISINDSSHNDGQNQYFAGTHFSDTVVGENNVNNEYYFVGQNFASSPPTDQFTGGSGGANVAIFTDARADYIITATNGSNVATIASNGLDPEHTGSLVASNVQVLAFGPAADPLPHNGIIDVNGGTDVILGGNNAITIEAGATAEIDSAVSSSTPYSATVSFEAPTGTLVLDQPFSFTGAIAAINGSGDVLDLAGFDAAHDTVTASTTGAYNSTTNITTLTVTDSAHPSTPLHLTLAGNYSTSTWTVTGDGHGGANIVDPPAPSNPGPVVMHDPGPAASNTFVASASNETLTGNGAGDTFVFNFVGFGHDTVTNFHPATDVLQFSGPIFANAQAAIDATLDDGHGNSVIALDAHDSITLLGVAKAQLHQTDFYLT